MIWRWARPSVACWSSSLGVIGTWKYRTDVFSEHRAGICSCIPFHGQPPRERSHLVKRRTARAPGIGTDCRTPAEHWFLQTAVKSGVEEFVGRIYPIRHHEGVSLCQKLHVLASQEERRHEALYEQITVALVLNLRPRTTSLDREATSVN